MSAESVDVRTRERERMGKFTIVKLIEFFKTLSPPKSAKENKIIEEMYKEGNEKNNSEMSVLEERLRNKIFLNGMEISEEDKTLFEKLKGEEISAEAYPNVFKWRKFVELSSK